MTVSISNRFDLIYINLFRNKVMKLTYFIIFITTNTTPTH